PMGGAPSVYEVQLTPTALRSVQGLVVRYFNGGSFDGKLLREEVIALVNVDWTRAQPIAGEFSAEFRGTLFIANYGTHAFSLRGAADGALWVDEQSVGGAPIQLAKGNHALRVRTRGGASKIELWWQGASAPQLQLVPASVLFRPPVTNSGLLGAYFPNDHWSGAPTFLQVDPEIALYFHNIPLPRPYSVEWKGKVFAPTAGPYRFATESIDDSQVLVNSQVVVNNSGHNQMLEGSVVLSQGWNDIVVRFADKTSHTHIYVYWVPPGRNREIVPSQFLSPPMGRYPTPDEMAALPRALPPADSPADASVPPTRATPQPAEALTLTPVQTIGERGQGPAQFVEPRAIALGDGGRLFVADAGNRRVQILNSDGGFVTAIERGEEPFVEPFDVAIAPTGELIVLDSEQGWLYRFDQQGRLLGRIGGPSAQFFHPRGITLDSQGNIYVADTGGSRVVKLAPAGQRLQVFGTKGTGKGQFVEAGAALVDADGFLFATDVPNRRVESFAADGKFLLDFPIPTAGAFNGPRFAFAPDGSLLM
ncbi:MAG: hypothetical protein LC737_08110, partial [Chloroflexi bacterium]|nr:hypothetical protein [Chloroflexota bacterium]